MKKVIISLMLLMTLLNHTYSREKLIVNSASRGQPYSWLEDDQMVGPVIDIINIVFSELNIEVEPVDRPWARAVLESSIIPLVNPLTSKAVHIAFSKKSPYIEYFPDVNRKIQQMYENGTIEKLFNSYNE